MDKIDKMMKENRELFMDQEPKTGHFDRFEKRLAVQSRRRRTLQLTYRISRFAAVGLLLLMSSLWAYSEFIQQDDIMMLGDVSHEYQEVEFFLTSQINTKYQELEQSPLLEDDDYKQSLLEELNQMDSEYKNLQEEMEANPGDERIINAMIQHYQTKLQVITHILNQLKSIQDQNNYKPNNPNQYESVEL